MHCLNYVAIYYLLIHSPLNVLDSWSDVGVHQLLQLWDIFESFNNLQSKKILLVETSIIFSRLNFLSKIINLRMSWKNSLVLGLINFFNDGGMLISSNNLKKRSLAKNKKR